jgi:6-pyruvoyltetrahydropterin/6-carboxytetrahydropterin synthase
MKLELKQHFHIESARYLPNLPKTHPCSKMHGHSFKISLSIIDKCNAKLGWVIDYNDITKIVSPILNEIDHKVLNEVKGLENPTTEILCVWLFNRIKSALPQISRITIAETNQSECSYPA